LGRRLAAATRFVVVAGTWLAGVCGKRAAISAICAGCVGSVVHRDAFLFKTKGACPATQCDRRVTAAVPARRLDARRVSERKKRAKANSVDLARFRAANPAYGFQN
jgi:hypothetical protein